MRRPLVPRLAALLLLGVAAPAWPQARPFLVEDPAPLDAGHLRVAFGLAYERGYEEPVYGLQGDPWHVPTVDAAFGLGDVAEFSVMTGVKTIRITERTDAPLASILEITGSRSTAPQDAVIATKFRIVGERGRRPAVSLRFAAKLPNAGNESGLGTDMTDVSGALLVGRTWQAWRVTGHVGLAILGDPTQLALQHDSMLYGVAVSRSVAPRVDLVGELSGRWLPGHPLRPGAEDRAHARAGVRAAAGMWRVDAAVIAGLTEIDTRVGVAIAVGRAFQLAAP